MAGARRVRVRVHPAAVGAWLLFLAALLLVPRVTPDEAAVRGMLERLGPLAPAAFVLAEAVQVVVIPIPGQPIEIPGGYLFGLVGGSLLASLGAIAGSIIAFALGRRYGRPWVEARVAPDVRGRFDDWLGRGHRAEWAVFWLMLVPAFPRDPLCYLAGLTRLPATRFAAIAAVGRPAGLIPWVALGADGVAVGVRLQLWLAAAAGAVWLLHFACVRLARRVRGPAAAGPDDGSETG
ncbi:MAG TPA: TVP38/TMEM64 family protein [Longimicrobiales bacterium]